MTHFTVRPRTAVPQELKPVYGKRVIWIRRSRFWLVGSELRNVERRDVVPLVRTLADKTRTCVEYDRRCAEITKARRS